MSVAQALGRPAAPVMGVFERWLTLWVGLCIVAGIALGQIFPTPFHALGDLTVAQVNLPIAALVWLMVVPMLLKIDLAALGQVRAHWRGIAVTVGVNWLVKPFSMALLGAIFIGWLFRPWLAAGQVDSYIAGLILLAAAPCTAMVCGTGRWTAAASRCRRCAVSCCSRRTWHAWNRPPVPSIRRASCCRMAACGSVRTRPC